MRVYIPATLAMLQQLVADGSFQPLSGTAFAVTPTLRESYAEGDDEELAEVAIGEAALASLRLLAAEAGHADVLGCRCAGRSSSPTRMPLCGPIWTTRWCGSAAG